MQEPNTSRFGVYARFTSEGFKHLAEWPDLYDTLEREVKSLGGKILEGCSYGIQGSHEGDVVVVIEGLNEQQVMQAWLPVLASGYVQTDTHVYTPIRTFNNLVIGARKAQAHRN